MLVDRSHSEDWIGRSTINRACCWELASTGLWNIRFSSREKLHSILFSRIYVLRRISCDAASKGYWKFEVDARGHIFVREARRDITVQLDQKSGSYLLEDLGVMILFFHFTLHYGVASEEIAYYDGYKRWQTRKISGTWIIYNRRLRQVSYHFFLAFSGSVEWAAERGALVWTDGNISASR